MTTSDKFPQKDIKAEGSYGTVIIHIIQYS